MRRLLVPLAVMAVTVGMTPFSAAAQDADPAVVGSFGPVFQEPDGIECTEAQQAVDRCKPPAQAIATMPNGKQLYWSGLEGMNNVDLSVVAEYGDAALNSAARVMDLAGGDPRWEVPGPFDGGANPAGNDAENEYLPGGLHNNDEKGNDGDLFCADLNFLPDGRIMAVGGTAYYQEPGIPGVPEFGVVELNGLKNTRVFDPASQTWSQSGQMNFARWYPQLVTQPDGSSLVFGGVTKLIKPVYPERPLDSGANERHVERFDPSTGQWTTLPDGAKKTLPLLPRMHLLPNGKTFFNSAGQTFNPAGQSYDEALWNFTSVFDPATNTWEDKGLNDFGGLPLGFRGSSFSVMMPLEPNADGEYTEANFLSAGGVYGTSPGTYLGTDTSTMTTIDTANGDAFSTRATGKLNDARVFAYGTMLPTGQVLASSGGDRDHTIVPGSESPVRSTEIFDPETDTWTETAMEERGRTYHTTATLLPDARVLVGGHAPIGTAYGSPTDAGTAAGLSDPNGDPTFQVFSPPYLFWGERPVITDVSPSVQTGQVLDVGVENADSISSIRMLRNTSTTHSVDADQRNVELRIVGRDDDSVQVQVPASTVLPPGPYMLFAHTEAEQGEIPSVSRQVFVDQALTAERAAALETAGDEQSERSEQAEQTIPNAVNVEDGSAEDSGLFDLGGPLPLVGAVVGFGGLLALGGAGVGRHRARRRAEGENRHRAL